MTWRIVGKPILILLLISSIGCTDKGNEMSGSHGIDPKYYVLVPDDVPGNLVLKKATYSDLRSKAGSKDYGLLESYNYSESFTVWYYKENKPDLLNAVIRFQDEDSAANMISYTKEQILDGVGSSKNANMVSGRDYGENSIYFFYNGSMPYYTSEIQTGNFVIRLSLFGEDVELSDLYPYLEILVKRVQDDERIIPPKEIE